MGAGLRISQRSIEDVREAADIVEVTSEFTALRRQGARFSGLCPYPDHQEKTPSFSVTPDKGFYYCFGCQKGGDAIKLLMDLKGLDFAEAVSYLADRSGVELQYEGGGDADAARKQSGRRKSLHKALAAATVYYHKYLLRSKTPEAEQARDYLKGRGMTISTIEEFRLGYVPRGGSGFFQAANKLGIQRSSLDASGLLSSRGGERFAGRVTFPISDRRGRIVGFGARTLGDAQPKYLNSPETEIFNKRDLLYGFPQVTQAMNKERAALIVEGYTDVLMLYQSGIKNAVATLGTATTAGHLRLLSSYVDRIYMLFDPDAAGEKALERADATVRELERSGGGDTVSAATKLKLDLRVVRLTEDPADWLREHSADEFRALLSESTTLLEYLFRRRAERARGAGAAERSRMMAEIQEVIGRIDDPVFYRDALRVAAEALGVSPQELQSGRRQRTAVQTAPERKAPSRSPLEQAGREALALMLAHPHLAEELLERGVRVPFLPQPFRLADADFANEAQAGLYRFLASRAGQTLDAMLSDEEGRGRMDELVALGAEAEEMRQNDLHSSRGAARETWIRLGILSRQRAMRDTPDYDRKGELQAQIQVLKEALRAVSS